MISHNHKCIFIHIPKTAGTSVHTFYSKEGVKLDWKNPDYNNLFGWCPKRKIHLQHATSKQLLETELISEDIWKSYFKFSFVRNPWDRSYSDYLWMMNDRGIKGSFSDYILKRNSFKDALTNDSSKNYRGDHLISQTSFLEVDEGFEIDFIGRFENLTADIKYINKKLHITKEMNLHEMKSNSRKKHYSHFYSSSKRKLVSKIYSDDIKKLNYDFEEKKEGFSLIKNFF